MTHKVTISRVSRQHLTFHDHPGSKIDILRSLYQTALNSAEWGDFGSIVSIEVDGLSYSPEELRALL